MKNAIQNCIRIIEIVSQYCGLDGLSEASHAAGVLEQEARKRDIRNTKREFKKRKAKERFRYQEPVNT
jgi:hypothetical protein